MPTAPQNLGRLPHIFFTKNKTEAECLRALPKAIQQINNRRAKPAAMSCSLSAAHGGVSLQDLASDRWHDVTYRRS
ncbi:uncharacterized protein [Kogia breviceps]|uniref:uncharacterized protein isoform X3 n=1 Tax=Kogia breviceps TaxID=27615 RepID=UPI0034D1CCD6